MSFRQAVAFTLDRIELEWTADRKTRWGIDQRFHPKVNLETLTREGAEAIYRAEYWRPIRGDDLPWPLALVVFDHGVHDGPGDAVRMLQTLCGAHIDGDCGPKTIAAARAMPQAELIEELLVRRARVLLERDKNLPGFMRRLLLLAVAAGRSRP